MTAPSPWDGRYVVYRIYAAGGVLLYVGCTRRGEQRWNEHMGDRRSAGWAHAARRVVVRIFSDERSALAAEADAILTERPVHNKHRGYTRREPVSA